MVASIILIGMALGVYWLSRPEAVETKGNTDATIAIIFSYLAMLLGMVAEYGYSRAGHGPKPFKIDMELLMPIFASPIVFIPVLTITSDMPVGGAFTKSKLMVYLVAFQNGFFWKSFFEERRQIAVSNLPSFLRKPTKGETEEPREPVLIESRLREQNEPEETDFPRSQPCVNESGSIERRQGQTENNRSSKAHG